MFTMSPILVTIILVLCGIFIVAGIILTVINLPGIWFIFLAYLISAITLNFDQISVLLVIVVLIITVLSTLIDNFVLAISSKKTGASIWGVVGALIGAVVGLFIAGPIGLIVGPFLGVVLFEIVIKKKEFMEAVKSGSGALIAFFITVILKSGVCIALAILWFAIILI